MKTQDQVHITVFEVVTSDSDIIIFTKPLRSGRIWHKVNFLSGV